MALSGSDVLVCLKVLHMLNGLRAQNRAADAQALLCTLWGNWRSGDKEYAPLEYLFDFYFHLQGDFEDIEKRLTQSLPAKLREEILTDVHACAVHVMKKMEGSKLEAGIELIPVPVCD
jgi:hypothetical protein